MRLSLRPDDCLSAPVPVAALPVDVCERLAARYKALGDPTRLEVFRLIAAQADPVCVCDITDRFTVSQPTISHHLKVLRETGLITVSRRGNWAFYAAEPMGLALLGASGDPIAAARLVGAG